MVLGYDELRPKEENYQDFLEKIKSGLKDLGEKGVSLMLYGSWVRGDHIAGRSDIDAVLIFPDNVVIDKARLYSASTVLAQSQRDNNIPFQVTVTDLRTIQDGRFNSFEPNFESYFNEEGRVVVGPDYRQEFNYSIATHSDQNALRFNLRKSRLGLLLLEQERQTNYERLLERFNKTLDATSRASKQVLAMVDGNLRKNRFSALEELSKVFPDLDAGPLRRIKNLYNDLESLDNLYKNPNELISVWNESVTFFESLVKSYLDKYP
jgi:predicted nucleotidyltransferase